MEDEEEIEEGLEEIHILMQLAGGGGGEAGEGGGALKTSATRSNSGTRSGSKTNPRRQPTSASGYKLNLQRDKMKSKRVKTLETTRSSESRDTACCSCLVQWVKQKMQPARERNRTWGQGGGGIDVPVIW